ncbi:MAG: protein translocase subunit SecD [Muribaculaceae bacterium]|nr:protein translocase subunit SecD [Muribaculaceae bacterium]
MQSKGTLGSIVAGVIAVFLVLVCLFYLSFTFVANKYEKEAQAYALAQSGNNNDDAYNEAYKHYMDSYANRNVYLGYTLPEVQKWGVNLGLDLKGGMNVILQVDMPDQLRSMRASQEPDSTFEKALKNTTAKVSEKGHENDDYVGLFLEEYRNLATAQGNNPDFAAVFNVSNLKAGASDDQAKVAIKEAVHASVENLAHNVLRNRIDQFGVVSPNIQVLKGKDGQIMMELPGVKDHQRVRDLLLRSANLEFYKTFYAGAEQNSLAAGLAEALANLQADSVDISAIAKLQGYQPGAGGIILGYAADQQAMNQLDSLFNNPEFARVLPQLALRWANKPTVQKDANGKVVKDKEGRPVEIGYALYALKAENGKPALGGDVVTDASTQRAQFGGHEVSMRMNDDAARQWANITAEAVENGKAPVAIVLDDRVYSSPSVNSVIDGGSSSITGDFSQEEANDLVNVLKSGQVKAKVNIISDMVIGPSLGQAAINAGMMSFIVALVLLMIFMVAFYGWIPGVIANLCLICNLFFTLGILASFQAVLTLSGIAGIVLSLGMAVDANVLIFERAKEELRAGKNIRTAVADGYSNAFSAIFDSNLTSIITGIILLLFGTGPIKGFATTLIIGLVCSFFTAVFLSRLFFQWISGTKAYERMTFTTALSRKMFINSHVNFLGARKVSFTIAGILIVAVCVSLATRGLMAGIDFSGGRNYMVKFEKPVNVETIQKTLEAEFPNSSVSVITIESSNQIRVSTNYRIKDNGPEIEQEIVGKLFKALSPDLREGMTLEEFSTTDASQGIISSQNVGPSVADEMRTDAYIAVGIALLAMFLYILVRFRNVAFSLGALAAVAFTAFMIVGFYSFFYGVLPFSMEIDQTFIAAILTVIGYQINDTVVVFDRVRENVGLYPKQDFYTLVNKSINSTLGRTIMTSASTLLVLLCIFILGGEAIRAFVFAMISGVVIGTLATIYIAAPVAYLTDARRKNAKIA